MDGWERALLATALPERDDIPRCDDWEADQSLAGVVARVLEGDYLGALQAAGSTGRLPSPGAGQGAADYMTETVAEWAKSSSRTAEERRVAVAAAAAALGAFARHHLTGPPLPASANAFGCLGGAAAGDDRHADVQRALESNGEELIGRIAHADFLLLALCLLPLCRGGGHDDWPASADWWAARALGLQQRILAARSAAVRSQTHAGWRRLLDRVAPDGPPPGDRRDRVLASTALLEAANSMFVYGLDSQAHALLSRAAQVAGLRFRVEGRLAKKTVHQVDATSVLFVCVEEQDACSLRGRFGTPCPAEAAGSQGSGAADEAGEGPDRPGRATSGLSCDSDVHLLPHFLEGDWGPELGALEQTILLAHATLVRKGQAMTDLVPAEAAPFVEMVMAQRGGTKLGSRAARLMMARKESARSRTAERGIVTFEALVEEAQGRWHGQATEGGTGVRGSAEDVDDSGQGDEGVRVCWDLAGAFAIWTPLAIQMTKEFGEMMLGAGLVNEALVLFEKNELLDAAIVCYRMLGKAHAAEAMVRERLQEGPDSPRLLCTLGDITGDLSLHERAWEASGCKYVRAQRTLATRKQEKGLFEEAIGHWELALAINPLHPDGWFALGHTCIRAGRFDRAIEACTRCVQLDPEAYEAWNNLAALLLRKGKAREAFWALSESVRLKRNSWQTWDNYAQAAAACADWLYACDGILEVLKLTQGTRLLEEVLAGCVQSFAELAAQVARDKGGVGPSAAMLSDDGAEGRGEGSTETRTGEGADGAGPSSGNGGVNEGRTVREVFDTLLSDLGGSLWAEDSGDAEAADPGRPGETPSEASHAGAHFNVHDVVGRERLLGQLSKRISSVLRVVTTASTSVCKASTWAIFANFWGALSEYRSQKECLVKCVRGLSTSQWRKDEKAFVDLAAASIELADCCLRLAEANPEGATKELTSAQMQLSGLASGAAKEFPGHEITARLQDALSRVKAAQQQAQA